jgi:plastocyanin
LLGTLCCVASGHAGDVRGQLVISRTLTKKKVIVPNYQMRGPIVSPPVQEISEYKRLAVYLEGASGETPASPGSATLLQENQRFDPEVIVVPVGSTVSFPNGDPIFHNVFSLSPVRPFDLGYYPEGETRTVQFDKTGVVQVFCHLHADMSAAIVVAPTRWHGQPDGNGAFLFADVPAGSYQLIVWHKSAGFFRRRVTVPAEGAVSVSMEIPLQEAPEP